MNQKLMKKMFNNVSQWIIIGINLYRQPKQYEKFKRLIPAKTIYSTVKYDIYSMFSFLVGHSFNQELITNVDIFLRNLTQDIN